MTTWRVLKKKMIDDDAYRELGEVESEYHYSAPPAQRLGEKFGPGTFMKFGPGTFILIAGQRVVETAIEVGPQTFYEVEQVDVEDEVAA